MNKNILAAVIFGSLSAITLPAQAKDINQTAQAIDLKQAAQATDIKQTAQVKVLKQKAQDYMDFFSGSECNSGVEETKACDINEAIITAISLYPIFTEWLIVAAINSVGANTEAAETLVASVISALGVDSPLIADVLKAATEAGVDTDTLTAIAIASGVDATIASEATAAGNTGNNNVIAGNTGNNTGNTGNTGNTNRGNSGGGGGGGGISDNQ